MYMAHATITNKEGRVLQEVSGFEWDAGNREKNLVKHNVTNEECEESFFDQKKIIMKDVPHSESEERYTLIGQTKQKRLLHIVFTVRNNRVRIISARNLNKKHYRLYEKEN
ncbi:hypothetical protein A3A03_01270 [Candidatus Nomurabacteria bacterium RIFCSPLOWO2_01_FULL_40_18]|uniref:BrnT family toxin n=1 Tax=Candidatus Nomurabacteria bacterium RIFCSPLOWO2_01_FULL_40_18 TaxID=1801773 RepID=A0A1F6XKX7_9BACT|nr:MAG: hypothetical protein A3A03_01270 [Candidatus Nomurabacteria bacterium RIFCSPLOWO2_01_FULL_40_18]